MNIENVGYILSNMDFSEWGIVGTLFVILQNAVSSNCDTLVKWAVGIGSILCSVIVAMYFKWQGDGEKHRVELSKVNESNKTEVSKLNTEILSLQKEHSRELRELHIKNASVLEKASDLLKLKSGI